MVKSRTLTDIFYRRDLLAWPGELGCDLRPNGAAANRTDTGTLHFVLPKRRNIFQQVCGCHARLWEWDGGRPKHQGEENLNSNTASNPRRST